MYFCIMVNLEWYRTFKAIYKTGTLTGAAKLLLISQPNVSQHLAALEAHIGKTLFDRKPRQMIPNEYGRLFYNQIIEAMDKLENVELDFRYVRNSTPPFVCIGMSKEFFYGFVATNLGQRFDNLIFDFGSNKYQMQKLLSGRSYVIINERNNEEGVVYEPIFEEHFVLLSNIDYDTTEFDRYIEQQETEMAEHWLCQQNWYAYSSNLGSIKKFWLENFKKKPTIKPHFVIPDFNYILKSLTNNGHGITLVPRYLAETHLKERQVKEIWKGAHTVPNTFYLCYKKDRPTTEQLTMVRSLLHMNSNAPIL